MTAAPQNNSLKEHNTRTCLASVEQTPGKAFGKWLMKIMCKGVFGNAFRQ